MQIDTLYKLLTLQEWKAAHAEGVYRGSQADLNDGYIHFSTAAQVEETARKHFTGVPDLILLAVDRDLLVKLHAPQGEGADKAALLPRGEGQSLPLAQPGEQGSHPLRWELSRDGYLFPHLYAHLPLAAVRTATGIELSDDGTPIIPSGLPA